jgi:DNA polymerase-3 subunit delta'
VAKAGRPQAYLTVMPELLDIVGQDSALVRLQQAMASARMPHAFLFAGPIGVGRRTTALALSKVLLCEQPAARPNAGKLAELPGDFPLKLACTRCPSCRAMDADTHVDFHLVYKELARYHEDPNVRSRVMQDLGIDVIRDFLIVPAGRSPGRGRGKVFVVLEAELLSESAQNALLKTLEEPPPGVTIILICAQVAGLLPTTLSRCSLVNFVPLPRDFVRDRLLAAGIKPPQADVWAAYTEGSLGAALRLAEQDMYRIKCDVLEHLAALDSAGETDLGEHLAKVAEDLTGRAIAKVKQEQDADLSKLLAHRRAGGELLALVASFFRDALTLATGADRPLTHADQRQAVASLAGRFSALELARIIEQIDEFERLLWQNVNPRLIWDNVALAAGSAAPLRP